MATELHCERLEAVVNTLLASGARRVLDLGCGDGELLQRLCPHPQFRRLVGIDIDERALSEARAALALDWLTPDERLDVRYGSFEDAAEDLIGFDAVVMLETIEHIEPGRLSKVERAVFAGLRPLTVLITTPNQEYNVLHGMAPDTRRHPGHRFEWTRAQFRQWARGVAERNHYAVAFVDLGPVDPVYGSSTQMARFDSQDAT